MEKLTDLELVKLSKTNLERTMNELQDRASSLLLLNLRWKEVEKVLDSAQSSLEERFKELKRKEEEFVLKLKDFDKRCEQIELEKKDLEQRFKDTKSKEKELAEQSKQLEMKRGLASALQPEVKTDAAGIFSVKYSVDHSSRAHLRFCVNMDGKDLQMFLNERLNKHDSVGTEVALALQLSSDPAKLVLDAMHGFYPPHLSKGGKEFEGNAARRSCILLLEQLNGLSPEIKPCVREKAMEHASDWLTKMRVKSGHELEVLGFLWLLAAFKLADNYEVEELLKYLQFVHDHIKSDEILKALVLGERTSYATTGVPSPVCPASASPSSTAPATIPTPEQQANQVDT